MKPKNQIDRAQIAWQLTTKKDTRGTDKKGEDKEGITESKTTQSQAEQLLLQLSPRNLVPQTLPTWEPGGQKRG